MAQRRRRTGSCLGSLVQICGEIVSFPFRLVFTILRDSMRRIDRERARFRLKPGHRRRR